MENKTIIVTGASRGLGFDICKRLSVNNTIIGVARKRPNEHLDNFHFYECDLGLESSIYECCRNIFLEHKKIDLLVNNAAVLTSLPLGVMKTDDISTMIDVNLKAPILLSRLIYRKMIREKSGGIVNITSMAPKLSVVGDSVYAATKSGLESFAKVLNKEGHAYGVHVNNIGISAYPSGMLEKVLSDTPEKILDLIPHKQFARIDDIVTILDFFSQGGGDIGGQIIYLGGV